ncbi:MAG TPA: hypothetical protein VGQ13_05865 [Nitrososphaera sp.]|nr:hypothetical protein [Nitrososphaera sp.]
MTTKKCTACHRSALKDNEYCLHHNQALDSITNRYKAWVNAYGSISWRDFLLKLSTMQETGSWAKEVIALELKK